MTRLLTVEEAAAVLAVSPAWVHNHLAEIPHRRVGRLIRFTRDDIETYLATVAHRPTPVAHTPARLTRTDRALRAVGRRRKDPA